MRILLTRPREDAEPLARKLQALGHETTIEPLIEIQPVDEAMVDLAGVQALLFTSANGVRAFAKSSERRDLPVFVVGDTSASAARDAGFARVESAAGDVTDLARLVGERLKPDLGTLLHVAGSVTAGDLAGQLVAAGFEVLRTVLYRAEPSAALSAAIEDQIRAGALDTVLFFSPRTAASFVRLARQAGLAMACRKMMALGLSPAVVAEASGLEWAKLMAADAPTESSLLDALAAVAGKFSAPKDDRMNDPSPGPLVPPPADTARSGPASGKPTASEPGVRATEPARRQGGRGASLVALLAVLGFAAGALWWFSNTNGVNVPAGDSAISALEARLSKIEQRFDGATAAASRRQSEVDERLAAIANRLTGIEGRIGVLANTPPPAPAADPALQRRIEALESSAVGRESADALQLAALSAENRRLAAELARLQESVAALTAALNERASARRALSLILAVGQLRDAVDRGGPFAAEIRTVQTVAGDDRTLAAEIAKLSPHSEPGIATRAVLRTRFDAVALEVARRTAGGEGDSWWQRGLARLAALVAVRPVGESGGDSPLARVARAEARLGANDLAGALAALDGIDRAAAAIVRPWREEASARAAADQALAALARSALGPGS